MRTHIDLFSGIGGFALAARWNGVQTVGFAEIDDYCGAVLRKHWPGVENYGDVRNVPAIESVWLVTGGFPCQPFSVAGKRKGSSDHRYEWPAMLAAIDRIRPTWVLGENVPGIIPMELDRVLADLEGIGYATWPCVVPAVAVDAPHERSRVWIIANANKFVGKTWPRVELQHKEPSHVNGFNGNCAPHNEESWLEMACRFYRMDDGLSDKSHAVCSLGNSIVPQVAAEFIRMMIEAEAQD